MAGEAVAVVLSDGGGDLPVAAAGAVFGAPVCSQGRLGSAESKKPRDLFRWQGFGFSGRNSSGAMLGLFNRYCNSE